MIIAKTLCDELSAAFGLMPDCSATEGGVRFSTHCLYPSFEPVEAFVLAGADGFLVHDGGGAIKASWGSGKDLKLVDAALQEQANLYHLSVVDGAISARVIGAEWLPSAIMAVANASASAARSAFMGNSNSTVGEATLRDMIKDVLNELIAKSAIKKSSVGYDFEARGKSGKRHHFDFALTEKSGSVAVIDAVSPHHESVSSRYVAFSDVSGVDVGIHGRFAVYQRLLDPEDESLLQQVADVVPLSSLAPQIARYAVQNS